MVKLGVVSSSPFLLKEGGAERHVWEFLRRARDHFQIELLPCLSALTQGDREKVLSKLDVLEGEGFIVPEVVRDLFTMFRVSRKEVLLNYVSLALHERLAKELRREVEGLDFLFAPNFMSPEVSMMGKPYGILVNGYLAPLHMGPIRHSLWKARIGQEPLYLGLAKSVITSIYWERSLSVMRRSPPKFIAGVNRVALLDKLSSVPGEKILIEPGFAVEGLSFVEPEGKGDYGVYMAARLVPSKGLFDLLEVVKRMGGRNFRIVILGRLEEYQEEFLRRVDEYELRDVIVHVGYLDGRDKREVISRAKVLIYPSHDDANSITVLESLSLGTPVVAYDIPGLRFVYEGLPNVELVREFDYEGMALRASEYLSGAKRFQLTPELKRFLESHSSWDRVIQQEIEVLRKYT